MKNQKSPREIHGISGTKSSESFPEECGAFPGLQSSQFLPLEMQSISRTKYPKFQRNFRVQIAEGQDSRGKIKIFRKDPESKCNVGTLIQNGRFNTIAIIGVGLIGGSIGLAVKKRRLANKLIGIGRNEISLKKALKKQAVDEITLDKSQVKYADLIILATPVGRIVPLIKELLPHLRERTVITDVGSTKKEMMDELKKFLPKNINFIGGHPLAGSEKNSVEFADADLFEKSICFLVPHNNTDRGRQSLKKLKNFWRELGACPVIISAEEHDFLMAGISHLPHIVAVTLVNSMSGLRWEGKEITEYAGQGWRDTTRISHGSPEVWIDILSSNKDKLLSLMEKFDKEWNTIKKFLKNGEIEKFKKILEQASKKSP